MADVATAALQTRGLTKFYGHHRGIEDLDLDVMPQEVYGFLGSNGPRPAAGVGPVGMRAAIGYLPGDLALTEGPHIVAVFPYERD